MSPPDPEVLGQAVGWFLAEKLNQELRGITRNYKIFILVLVLSFSGSVTWVSHLTSLDLLSK